MRSVFLCIIVTAFCCFGCMTASKHAAQVRSADDRLTAGTVQRSIRHGMSGAEVATVLGSPNIVTTDEEQREVWVYDKIATETIYSTSEGGIFELTLSGAQSKSQRTLTVVIKFDKNSKVRDFAYHASRF